MFKLFLLFLLPLLLFSEEVWVDSLRKIVFSGSKEALEEQEDFPYDITFLDLYVPDEKGLTELAYSFLSKPITPSFLREIKEKVVSFYKEHDCPVVGVIIPPGQDITDGELKIIVIVGRVGRVIAKGARWFSNQMIRENFHMYADDLITKEKLTCELNWLNKNPFYTTNLILEPGNDLYETNIVLFTEDRFPMRVYGGYENTGNLIAGRTRYMAGWSWGNVFARRDILNALWMTSPHVDRWWAITASYTLFVPRKNILELYGAFTRAEPNVHENIATIGKGWQIAGKYFLPFCIGAFQNKGFFGWEFKRTNNFLNFGDTLIFTNNFDISQFVFGFQSEANFSWGTPSMGIAFYVSPGKMTPFNFSKYFDQERPGAKANYFYGEIYYNHTVQLPRGFGWLFNLKFQESSGKLLPSEEFSLGGFYTVRGYDENEVIGDNGLLIKNELRTKKMVYQPNKGFAHNLQFLAFCDFGITYDTDPNIVTDSKEVLASIGPGIRYTYGPLATFRFDYGYQIITIKRLIDESKAKTRAHLSLIVGY